MKRCIAVIGGAECTAEEYAWAEEVGRGIALKGAVLITGGLSGVMEGASKGAKGVGGLVIGVIPSLRPQDANPYVDIAIVTGMGDARNVIIISSASAIIAIGGATGTLNEIALALKRGLPLVGLNTWNLPKERLGEASILTASTPQEAIEMIFQRI
jgi:hypothetical protein